MRHEKCAELRIRLQFFFWISIRTVRIGHDQRTVIKLKQVTTLRRKDLFVCLISRSGFKYHVLGSSTLVLSF